VNPGGFTVDRLPVRVLPDGDTLARAAADDAAAALLREHQLDLCCLGIGENGHLAFNDPPVADFDDPLDVKVASLDGASRRQQVGEGLYLDRESASLLGRTA
jgi:glucosamine-6-phosphate deaminase